MKRYQHPSISNGQVTHGDDVFAVVDGFVELPDHIAAHEHGFAPAPEDARPSAPSSDAPMSDVEASASDAPEDVRPKGRRR